MSADNPISVLRDQLERIQLDATKKAEEARADQLELGMNKMVQQVQQAASAAMFKLPVNGDAPKEEVTQ